MPVSRLHSADGVDAPVRRPGYGWLIVAALLVLEVVVLVSMATSVAGLPTEAIVTTPADAAVTVEAQKVFGAVAVGRVVTPVDAWVTVRAVGADGLPAELLGATSVSRGEHRDVAVAVDRTRTLPDRVFVGLVADDGVAGEFEYATGFDDAVVPVGAAMMAEAPTADAGEAMMGSADRVLVADGALVGAEVDVEYYDVVFPMEEAWLDGAYLDRERSVVVAERVIAPADGWVAVIRGRVDDADANELLAYRPVTAGRTFTVEIPLSKEPGPGALTVLLAADLGEPGVLEIDPSDLLGSPDAPFFALGYFVQVPVRPTPPPAR